MDYEVKTVIDNIDDMTDIIKNQLNDIAEVHQAKDFFYKLSPPAKCEPPQIVRTVQKAPM